MRKYEFDAAKTKDEIVEWIRNYFRKNGPDCNAVIGISGGKDSSIVAALCCEALGNGRVIGVLMPQGYFDENMRLLKEGSMDALFGPAPIYTKIRDDNPTRYLEGSSVKNSLLADGCVIEGTVENSVLFRGCKIKKGAVVKNCVLMQDTVVEPNCNVEYVVTDKNVHITEDKKLAGTDTFPVFVAKNHSV